MNPDKTGFVLTHYCLIQCWKGWEKPFESLPILCHTCIRFYKQIRPAFVNTLFPVTRPHHIYSTALVIIILVDNLKYVIIFVYMFGFFCGKFQKFPKKHLGVQVSKTYCSHIYYTCLKFTWLTFLCALSAKKEGQKSIKRSKTKD